MCVVFCFLFFLERTLRAASFSINLELLELYLFNFIVVFLFLFFTKMHLVAKGQRCDSLQKGIMFFKELNVFMSILYTLETVGRKRTCWKNMIFKSNSLDVCMWSFWIGQKCPLVRLKMIECWDDLLCQFLSVGNLVPWLKMAFAPLRRVNSPQI